MLPKKIHHYIQGHEMVSSSGKWLDKYSPMTGVLLSQITRGTKDDVSLALTAASATFSSWSARPVIERANILRKMAALLQEKQSDMATIVHEETGKSMKDALAEVAGAAELGYFMAGEGRRYYGKTTTSAMEQRMAYTIRQPVGVCALIIPFNTPIANVAWKVFPALVCGNTVVVKAAKDTPYTPVLFGKLLKEAGVPDGVYSVVQGTGEEAGEALIRDPRVSLISFTGSTAVGKHITEVAAAHLTRVSLELGGKNALVVCDDADIDQAVRWAVLSAFSNAGQRCAAGSRIIVFSSVYKQFKKKMIVQTKALRLGSTDADDVGPVINESQLNKIIAMIDQARADGGILLTGGKRATGKHLSGGYFLEPTIIEGLTMQQDLSRRELFGPVTNLYPVDDFDAAVTLVNDSDCGLTAALHTANMHRVQEFIQRARVGVVSINGATYGSEPHLPFGGLKQSGNGHREPGEEALDVYSEWKTVYIKHDIDHI